MERFVALTVLLGSGYSRSPGRAAPVVPPTSGPRAAAAVFTLPRSGASGDFDRDLVVLSGVGFADRWTRDVPDCESRGIGECQPFAGRV